MDDGTVVFLGIIFSFAACSVALLVIGYLFGTHKNRKLLKQIAIFELSDNDRALIESGGKYSETGIDGLALRRLIHHADISVGSLVVWMLKLIFALTIAVNVIIGPIVLLGGLLFLG